MVIATHLLGRMEVPFSITVLIRLCHEIITICHGSDCGPFTVTEIRHVCHDIDCGFPWHWPFSCDRNRPFSCDRNRTGLPWQWLWPFLNYSDTTGLPWQWLWPFPCDRDKTFSPWQWLWHFSCDRDMAFLPWQWLWPFFYDRENAYLSWQWALTVIHKHLVLFAMTGMPLTQFHICTYYVH